jgi:hypothetical protein
MDEVAMDMVPVVFGSAKRYFVRIAGQHLLEDPPGSNPGNPDPDWKLPVRMLQEDEVLVLRLKGVKPSDL